MSHFISQSLTFSVTHTVTDSFCHSYSHHLEYISICLSACLSACFFADLFACFSVYIFPFFTNCFALMHILYVLLEHNCLGSASAIAIVVESKFCNFPKLKLHRLQKKWHYTVSDNFFTRWPHGSFVSSLF